MKIDKKLFRAGPYSDFFSQGVQVGNILTLAGQLGYDVEGKVPESIREQMENCYKNIQDVLNEFGASLENIIDETWFVTDVNECMKNVDEIFAAREKIYGRKPEVSQTLVGTTALVSPDYKIEIKCIAYL
jgi:enamine deaminase RidA (YjgF/YER057c/UK114 family)